MSFSPAWQNKSNEKMNKSECEKLGLPVAHPDSATATDKSIYLTAAFIFIPLSTFAVAANGTIIISLLLSHFRNPHVGFAVNVSIVKSLMISMAVSDAIIGSLSMPLAIYELFMYGHWALGQSLCIMKQVLDVFLCTVSIYHVTCMAVDRYLAVCRPFSYRTLTINTGYLMIGVSWGIPAVLSLVPFLGDWHTDGITHIVTCFQLSSYCSIIFNLPYQVTSALISFYIPMVTTCVLYYLIARKVWRVSKRFSGKAFRNSIFRLRRNFYSLPNTSRHCGVSVNSLTETGATLEEKGVEMRLNDTNSRVSCTTSYQQTCPKTSSIGEQIQQQQSCKTIADTLPISGTCKSMNSSPVCTTYTLASTSSELRDEGNNATSHTGHSHAVMTLPRSYPGTKLTSVKSASCGIIDSSDKKTSRIRLFHEQTTASHQQNNENSQRTFRDRHKGGFGNMKAVRTIASVVVCFMLCWMPFSIYIVIESYYNYALPLWPYVLLTWLGYLNSALNPVLYCGNRSIRQTVKSCICPSTTHISVHF